ncbi:MAG: hypothetical protein AAGA40_13770 [Cyanobacteria bacterium P01_E01_bin.45]
MESSLVIFLDNQGFELFPYSRPYSGLLCSLLRTCFFVFALTLQTAGAEIGRKVDFPCHNKDEWIVSGFVTSEIWHQYFDAGMRAGKLADYDQAESNFRAAIAMASDEPYPHYELGYTMLLKREYEEALAEFRATDDLARGFFQVQAEIYMCEQLLAGDIDEHVLSLLQRLQQMSESGSGSGKQAEDVARDVIRFSPNCALGHLYLGKALSRRDPIQAEASLERCLQLSPDETTLIDAKSQIGLLWSNEGRSADARQLWRELQDTYSGHLQLERLEEFLNPGKQSGNKRSTPSFWQKLFGRT